MARRVFAAAAIGFAAFAIPLAAGAQDASGLPMLDKSVRPTFLVAPPASKVRALARRSFAQAGAGLTIPYWSTQVTSPLDGHTYDVSMVGSSPFAPSPSNTNITYVPIVVKLHFPKAGGGEFVFDPTANGNCDTQSPSRRFFNSPLFRPTVFTSNGVNVSAIPGGTQLTSANQRAEFWGAVQGTNYGATLIPSRLSPIVVDYTVTNPQDRVLGVSSQCGGPAHPFGEIDINEYDNLVQSLATQYAAPDQIPVVLTYNVVQYDTVVSNCCIIGYHNAVPVAGGTQVYSVGAYLDSGIFGAGIGDIYAWGHELAELFNDPFVQSIGGVPGGFANDITPAWGHTGQVDGCQNNLESGDPLTGGPLMTTAGVGGFVYHNQDEAFISWFYRTSSIATGGKGSFMGTFGAGQPTVCVG